MRPRICFLFNHDTTHQIAHSLPIALALARSGEAEIVLACGSPRIAAAVDTLCDRFAPDVQDITRRTLELSRPSSRMLEKVTRALVPARKLLLYRDNLDVFRSFDAIVVSEKTSLLLKTRYGLTGPRLIHTRHGAGDRAIGFDQQSALFDLVLVSGPKIEQRLVAEAGVPRTNIRMVGYVKFELFADTTPPNPFADDEPIALYNPHPSPRLTSWYAMGNETLDALTTKAVLNTIFAPHVMMFARQWTVTIAPPAVRKTRLPRSLKQQTPRLHVDLGSDRATDMSWTNLADLYVGDVSSQVYEYLYRPRPCLFLNAHDVDWKGDPAYRHWNAGPVIGPGDDIAAAARHAVDTHPDFVAAQRELVAETFSITDRPASERAADAILEFLTEQP